MKKNVKKKKKFFDQKNFVLYHSNFDQNSNFMNFDENFRSKKSLKSSKFDDFYIKINDFDENLKKKVACGGHPGISLSGGQVSDGRLRRG